MHILPEIVPITPYDREEAGPSSNDSGNDEQGGRNNYNSVQIAEQEEKKVSEQSEEMVDTARG